MFLYSVFTIYFSLCLGSLKCQDIINSINAVDEPNDGNSDLEDSDLIGFDDGDCECGVGSSDAYDYDSGDNDVDDYDSGDYDDDD